jgi:hypothetical protein
MLSEGWTDMKPDSIIDWAEMVHANVAGICGLRARGQYSVINTLKKHAADEILFCRDIRTLHSPGLAGADPIIRDPAAIFARLAMPLRIWTHPARESAGRGNTGALNDNNFLKGGDDTK